MSRDAHRSSASVPSKAQGDATHVGGINILVLTVSAYPFPFCIALGLSCQHQLT